MKEIKVIKTKSDYNEALAHIAELIDLEPVFGTVESDKLLLLSSLVEDYESGVFKEDLPTPIEAIAFRMEQLDLVAADLVPYLGSKARVSEILSGKRTLTLEMIRALESGLGIPSRVLIQKSTAGEKYDPIIVKEMKKRGYFDSIISELENMTNDATSLVDTFLGNSKNVQQYAFYRKSTHYRSSPTTNRFALDAWIKRVEDRASQIDLATHYNDGTVTADFMQKVARLSVFDDGPILARELLAQNGIRLIIEPHLPKSYLDGIAIMKDKQNPIIGLTLRHDRVDNFWFTLMHELAHISKHFNGENDIFIDEIEGIKTITTDQLEIEADEMAQEVLLPNSKWQTSPARIAPSEITAKSLARDLEIHPAIIAGQIRHRNKKYTILTKMISGEKVSTVFNTK